MDVLTRFSGLVRKGLRFRTRFEDAKRGAPNRDITWYPYDCFANLFYLQRLLRDSGMTLDAVMGGRPMLDLGAADGALSFFFESLGYAVDACDFSGTNMNHMLGIRSLASVLHANVTIHDLNLDARCELPGNYGAALFLGTLYHLKNPFYALETLACHARYAFVSTRVARQTPDRTIQFGGQPVAYLVDPGECNSDATNYWIFSPAGLTRLVRRAGWEICASASSGATSSDPVTQDGDERVFLLLRSTLGADSGSVMASQRHAGKPDTQYAWSPNRPA